MDAAKRAGHIIEIRERYYHQVANDRSRVSALIPLIFKNPFITVRRVQATVGVTSQGARNLLDRAEGYGWVEYMGALGSAGRYYYAATEVLDAIEKPTVYEIQKNEPA
jgi:hypothetical protein